MGFRFPFTYRQTHTLTHTLFFFAFADLAAIRKILENETGGALCPSCQMPFDKGKKRKLIDACGHERCYSCMFRNEACPHCLAQSRGGTAPHQLQQTEVQQVQRTGMHQADIDNGKLSMWVFPQELLYYYNY